MGMDYNMWSSEDLAGFLAFDILNNESYLPLDEYGFANRDNIEDAIIIAMYSGELGPLDQETVELAIDIVNDAIQQERKIEKYR